MTDLRTLNRVQYSGYDFDTHLDSILGRVQVKAGAFYNDWALASTGMMLFDLVAFGLDTLSFYLDRRATEVYLVTARTRRAVSRLSRQLGYKMGGAVASSTDLEVTVVDVQAVDVTIPEGFAFNGPDDLVFQCAESVTFTVAEQTAGTTKLVPVYEGEFARETFTSNGTADQNFAIRGVPESQFMASGKVTVTVDGSEWEEQEFLNFGATDQFEVAFNDDPPTLRFGDAVLGNIPATGASIVIEYIITSGKQGGAAKDTIQEVSSTLVVVGSNVALTLTNPAKAGGGDDPETLAHAKAFAGRYFATRQVAVTQPDYTTLAGRYADPVFGRVAVAQAVSSRSAAQDLYLITQLGLINAALEGPADSINALIAANAVSTDSSAVLPSMSDALVSGTESVQGSATSIATAIAAVDANLDAAIASIRSNRNITLEIDSQAAQGKTYAGTLGLSPSEVANLEAYFDQIISKSTSIRGACEGELATLSSSKDETDKVGSTVASLQVDGTDAYVKVVYDQATAVDTLIGTDDLVDPSASTGLYFDFNSVLADIAVDIDPNLTNNAAAIVATANVNILAHQDALLSADCKANLVTVPILVRDTSGFYASPSLGLIASLQTHLDARKEVTQTVRVVDGGEFLLFPVLVIRLGVIPGFSLEQTRTAVESVVDGVLRDREFGVDLMITDLSVPIKAVPGVAFANVTISGYTTTASSDVETILLDPEGNLIIDESHAITKAAGSVTVTPETAPQAATLTA